MDQPKVQDSLTSKMSMDAISLTPINPSQIPDDDVLLGEAQALLSSSRSWPIGKTYYDGIKSYLHREKALKPTATGKSKGNMTSQTWHCLVTDIYLHAHADEEGGPKSSGGGSGSGSLSFSRVWSKLGRDKVWNQKSYLTKISKITRIKYLSESQSIWTVLVAYPPPLSPRVFTFFQASWLLEHTHLRRGIIVTLPIVLDSRSSEHLTEIEERGVRGRFVSVEHLQEMDANTLEWRRVISVDLGGFISNFWARQRIAKRLAEEKALFISWLKTVSPEETWKAEEEREREHSQERSIQSWRPQSHRKSWEEEEVFDYQDGDTNTQSRVA